jgi:hypothetical protein
VCLPPTFSKREKYCHNGAWPSPTIAPHQRRAGLGRLENRDAIVRRDGAESTDQAAAPPARKPFRDLVWAQIDWLVQQ